MSKKHAQDTPSLIWQYEVGPPRRPVLWYVTVIAIGLLLVGLFGTVTRWNDWTITLSPVLWVCLMLGMSLMPSRTRIVTLERDLLTIRDAKHTRGILEFNLREFAAYAVEIIEEDTLNTEEYRMKLLRRDGKGTIEFALPEDTERGNDFIERVGAIVPPAPETAPTRLQRIGKLIDRWVGWR